MSGTALSAAMMKAYKEGLGVDFALVCQGVTKHVHSQVLCLAIFDEMLTVNVVTGDHGQIALSRGEGEQMVPG